jgi:hypothetical protein
MAAPATSARAPTNAAGTPSRNATTRANVIDATSAFNLLSLRFSFQGNSRKPAASSNIVGYSGLPEDLPFHSTGSQFMNALWRGPVKCRVRNTRLKESQAGGSGAPQSFTHQTS